MRNAVILSLIAATLFTAGIVSAYAQSMNDWKAPEVTKSAKMEAQLACSNDWKAWKVTNGKPEVGTGQAVWVAFRKECVARRMATDANANPMKAK